ncbi:MAG TPA: tagaturonate reductase [Desulfosporosinus sp.]|nr:tagaturonate reductase [Desulfosporosinus sp.]
MQNLNRQLLEGNFQFPEGLEVGKFPAELPEKIIQFGEGNFLRAFVDWMVHEMNQKGLFNGRIVVVCPLPEGKMHQLNEQDGLYTLILRGMNQGRSLSQEQIISSVSRGIDLYENWQNYLKCAENPEIEFVVSNTTEAGIVYNSSDRPENAPPSSFPAKLAVYLYHRYQFFSGDPKKGMVMLPCELIEKNGDHLKRIILRLATEWEWPNDFCIWIEKHNQFLNTLVDRVVPGYPKDEIAEITNRLGYKDPLLDTGELFHLWVIEGAQDLKERLPFTEAGLNVLWTDDMTPYRTRKVRILNGSHTSCVPVAFLYGLDTVGEMVKHPVLGRYTREVIFEEIIPAADYDEAMLKDYANAVVERFENPYIKHYLLSILLNSTSKFKARVLPTILDYNRKTGLLPLKLSFSLAALLALYYGTIEGSTMKCCVKEKDFLLQDDLATLELMQDAWKTCDQSIESIVNLVRHVFGQTSVWGQDLNKIAGLAERVASDLHAILHEGIEKAIERLFY